MVKGRSEREVARYFGVYRQTVKKMCQYAATLNTSNLPFDKWISILDSKRLTGALLDRLTHHVHMLEMNPDFPLRFLW